ncbi:MAG: thioredoxin [Candidatus Omnitrophica bacterium]|nr:thioredoxin [Candidatus Omnitrophota bacterium]
MSESKHVISVYDTNFEEVVLKSEIPVLVDFWAEWCGPCKMISPVIDQIAEQYNGKVKVCKVNIDQEQAIAADYGVMSIPTLAIFKGGELVDTIVGAVPKSSITYKLDSHL